MTVRKEATVQHGFSQEEIAEAVTDKNVCATD